MKKRIYINNTKTKYVIYDSGKVVNTKSGIEVHPYKGKNDRYFSIYLYHNSKQYIFKLHRLVAEYFIPNADDRKTQVNHINGNKNDNFVENLEWVSPKENMQHALKHGLLKTNYSADKVRLACKLMEENKLSQIEISNIVGMTKQSLNDLKHKRTWTHITDSYNFPDIRKTNNYRKFYKIIQDYLKMGYDNKRIIEKLKSDELSEDKIKYLIRRNKEKVQRLSKGKGPLIIKLGFSE